MTPEFSDAFSVPFFYNTHKNFQYVFALFYIGSGTLNCGNFSSHKQLLRKQVQGCAIQAVKNQHLGLLGDNSISIRRDFLFHCLNIEALTYWRNVIVISGSHKVLETIRSCSSNLLIQVICNRGMIIWDLCRCRLWTSVYWVTCKKKTIKTKITF